MRIPLIVVATALALASGCQKAKDNSFWYVAAAGPYGDPSATVEFGGPYGPATPEIRIREGSAVARDIVFFSHSSGHLPGTLQSQNSSVLQVIPLSSPDAGYGFIGVAAGATSVVATLDGQTVETVAAIVEAPPPSSIPPSIDAGALVALQNLDEEDANAQDGGALDASVPDANPMDATMNDAPYDAPTVRATGSD
ncbi:MAG: hypothetical protein ACLP1X_25810 [Polyangiaceae bacterium]|jgi:hypothetical protein